MTTDTKRAKVILALRNLAKAESEIDCMPVEDHICWKAAKLLEADKACREPVEYQIKILGERWTHCAPHLYQPNNPNFRALYTNPQPAQQPLTKEQIAAMFTTNQRRWMSAQDAYHEAVRDTEAAHGIGKDQP